jgi:hypothetical protein
MNPEIAALRERIAEGGDWKALREEIVRLHKQARTQEEYVTLLEAHHRLRASVEHCFPAETAPEIQRMVAGEYTLFLNIEAMEGDEINPVMLERITAREVAAGRLAAGDEFRKLAETGGSVLGDSADRRYDRRLGNAISIGAVVLGAVVFFTTDKIWGLVVLVVGMSVGALVNWRRQRRAVEAALLARAARGYE